VQGVVGVRVRNLAEGRDCARTGSEVGSMAQVQGVVGMEGSTALVEVGSMVQVVDAVGSRLVLAQGMAGNTQAQALAEVDNIPVVAQGMAGDTRAQALAEVDNIPVLAQGMVGAGNTQAQALAEDKAGRQADGILALGKDEDMAQGMVDRQARDTGVVGTLAGGTRAQGQVPQQAQDEVQE